MFDAHVEIQHARFLHNSATASQLRKELRKATWPSPVQRLSKSDQVGSLPSCDTAPRVEGPWPPASLRPFRNKACVPGALLYGRTAPRPSWQLLSGRTAPGPERAHFALNSSSAMRRRSNSGTTAPSTPAASAAPTRTDRRTVLRSLPARSRQNECDLRKPVFGPRTPYPGPRCCARTTNTHYLKSTPRTWFSE